MKRVLVMSGLLSLSLAVYVGSFATRVDGESDIGRASAVAVLSSGNLIVGISHANRVQVYSPEGELLAIWPVDSGRGGIRLKALPGGGFQAATVRNRRLYIFDSGGKLETVEEDFDGYASFDPQGQWEAQSMQGDHYRLDGSTLSRRRGSSDEVIVDHRYRLPFVGSAFLFVLLLVSGVAQLLIAAFGFERFRKILFGAAKLKQPSWSGTGNGQ